MVGASSTSVTTLISSLFFFLSNFVSFYLIIITIGDGGAGKAYVDGLEAVEIDEGTFKYVLIEAEGTKGMRR